MNDTNSRAAIKGIGEAFFGERWNVPLAAAIGVTSQHLGGVMDGKYSVSDQLAQKVLNWTKQTGVPAMRDRYKSLLAHQASLAILSAQPDAALDNDSPEFRN